MGETITGYAHPAYAASLAEFGTPRLLPECGGWILERAIQGLADRDAMGCYPLFVCQDWSRLGSDLANVAEELVSIAVVTDPFSEYDEAHLRRCFKDVVIPFKDHFITDLGSSSGTFVSKHHRYYARKALERLRVEVCDHPSHFAGEWTELYKNLIARHGLTGIKAFSAEVFAKQLRVPGAVMLRATLDGAAVGAHLWYVQDEVAYSHLAASSPLGYELMSSYALYWVAIEHFSNRVRWLDLGAGAGAGAGSNSGLSRFKRGWATTSRVAYFCGRIFDSNRYASLSQAKNVSATAYFPAYRAGEFG